ncbi:MAG: hypothetical protein AB1679_01440 [Actinomycetota bacterium]|jgi:hypothetical protein
MLRWRRGPQRVLVEDPDSTWHPFLAGLLDPEDYILDFCPGPHAVPGGCPLLAGLPCPRADWADIVLSGLDRQDALEGHVLELLPTSHPGMSLRLLNGDAPTRCRIRSD